MFTETPLTIKRKPIKHLRIYLTKKQNVYENKYEMLLKDITIWLNTEEKHAYKWEDSNHKDAKFPSKVT